jgi:antitoxin HigA-1
MPMKNPPHPGRIVWQECLKATGLGVTDAGKALGVSRNAMSELVNGRRGISPEMAIRLAKAFGSAPEVWAGLQLDYDMAQAMKHAKESGVCRGLPWGRNDTCPAYAI